MIALSYGGEYTTTTDGYTTGELAPTAVRGRVYSVYVHNISAVDAYLQVFDKASAPGSGDSAIMVVPIGGGMYGGMNWQTGRRFSNGLRVQLVQSASVAGDATKVEDDTAFVEVCWSGIP